MRTASWIRRIGMISLLAALTSTAWAQPQGPRPDDTLRLGRGYDSVTADFRSDCVTLGNIDSLSPGGHGERTLWLLLVESRDQLHRLTGVNAAASLRSLSAGVNSKLGWLREVSITQYSVYLYVHVTVGLPATFARTVTLEPRALQLATTDPQEFHKRCGDEYFSSISEGGELLGIIEIETRSTEEKRQLTSSIGSKLGTFSSSVELSDSMKHAVEGKRVKTFVYIRGGKFEQSKTMPMDIALLIETAAQFPNSVMEGSNQIAGKTSRYEHLLSFPEGVTPIDLSRQEDTIDYLSQRRVHADAMLADINFVLEHQEQFQEPNVSALNQARGKLVKLVNGIARSAKICLRDPKSCDRPEGPEEYDVPEVQLPARKDDLAASACTTSRHELCGIETYQTLRSEHCGVESYRTDRGAACGVDSWLEKRSAACGVETYKLGSGPVCGVARYNSGEGGACGYGTKLVPCEGGDDPRRRCRDRHEKTPKTCEHPSFGVAAYQQCRHANFGVDSYRSCRHESHGVDQYKSCEHQSFGVLAYKQCQSVHHGVQAYRECRLQVVDGRLTRCP